MISRQVRWSLQAGVVMVTLAIFSLPSGGHHITRFGYTCHKLFRNGEFAGR